MAYNRYQQQSSPWASGAPPMYGNHSHAPPPPPPQYGTPAYGHSSAPWNVTPPMRQSGGWGAPAAGPNLHHMQANQRRGGGMRGPIPGPTGKRGNMGSWEGPANKRFAKQGGGRGGQAGGNWRRDGGGQGGGQKFQNRPFNRDNRRNNREVNRTKQNDTQLERRQQHDQAQKAAESLDNKEYPIEQTVKSEDAKQTDDKNKNLEIDAAQEKYLLAVFGYVCQVCSVFLKDKSARFDHCHTEDHLTKFNVAEEERIKKEEIEKKNNETEDETNKANENSAENKTEDKDSNENLENGEKSENIEKSNNNDINDKTEEDPKDETENNQEEEIKTINEETPVIAEQPIGDLGGKGQSSEPVPQGVDTPTPAVNSQSGNTYSGGEFTPNRGRGNYPRGRGGHGGRGGPRGRGRNRGRGRK